MDKVVRWSTHTRCATLSSVKCRVPYRALSLTFLGTSSAKPTKNRNVTSVCLQNDKWVWMFDCGEGTQHQMMRKKLRRSKLDKVFITHLHGDHIYGLPGLLCELAWTTLNEYIDVYGPVGLRTYLRTAASVSAGEWMQKYMRIHDIYLDHGNIKQEHPASHFDQNIYLEKAATTVFEDDEYVVKAAPIIHTVPCVGYIVSEKSKPGSILADKLKSLNIPPGPIYKLIKEGKISVLPTGQPASQFLSPSIPGRKVVLLGDTCDPSSVIEEGANCDVLVHEATFSDAESDKAVYYGHSTAKMAGEFAQKIGAKHLILTHFSPRLDANMKIETIVKEAAELFKGPITPAEDFMEFKIPIIKRHIV